MLKATADKVLPTTITGSLPRPSWYTENLGTRSFLDAMVTSRYREQYVDALSVYLRDQEIAGLDIVTDGDCRFDQDVGGQSWTGYPPHHMDGFDRLQPKLAELPAPVVELRLEFVELRGRTGSVSQESQPLPTGRIQQTNSRSGCAAGGRRYRRAGRQCRF